MLQWGHVFSDVEMTTPKNCHEQTAHKLQWATSFQTWKSNLDPFWIPPDTELQWGHVFSDVEISR